MGYTIVRDPVDGARLFDLDAGRCVIAIKVRGALRHVDLTQYGLRYVSPSQPPPPGEGLGCAAEVDEEQDIDD